MIRRKPSLPNFTLSSRKSKNVSAMRPLRLGNLTFRPTKQGEVSRQLARGRPRHKGPCLCEACKGA